MLRVVNVPPSVPPIDDQVVPSRSPFILAIPATDADRPTQNLSLAQVSAPVGARIDRSGLLTWTPDRQEVGIHLLTVRVSDDGQPSLSTERTFQVEVVDAGGGDGRAVSLEPGVPEAGQATLTFSGTQGLQYVTEFAVELTGPWTGFGTTLAGPDGGWSIIDAHATNAVRFYRARLP